MSLEGEVGGRKPQFRTYTLPWKVSFLQACVTPSEAHC
jgi:hypothetical protein